MTNGEGLRERKKQETKRRIAEAGLRLFIAKGYDATTLCDIAEEAGVARRTFFSYFASKEAVLLVHTEGGFAKALRPVLLSQSPAQTPLVALQNSILQVMALVQKNEVFLMVNRLPPSDAVRARVQTSYVEMEQAAFDGLCELYPAAERRAELRLVAMVALGAFRLAKEAWHHAGGNRPLTDYLGETFATLDEIV